MGGSITSDGRNSWMRLVTWATGLAGDGSASAGSDDEAALAELRWPWGAAYEISFAKNAWTARRRAGSSPLLASSADELLHLMRMDYVGCSAERPPEPAPEVGECELREPGPGERALRKLLDDGII